MAGQVRFAALFVLGVFGSTAAIEGSRALAASAREQATVSEPVRLIMVETLACPYCIRWHSEIGPAYPASPEGKFAPLERFLLGAPEIKDLKPVAFTPTFIVMRGNTETGRLVGYPGQDYFWDELREVLVSAGFDAKSPDASK
jgi:protein-disulfide isomerase